MNLPSFLFKFHSSRFSDIQSFPIIFSCLPFWPFLSVSSRVTRNILLPSYFLFLFFFAITQFPPPAKADMRPLLFSSLVPSSSQQPPTPLPPWLTPPYPTVLPDEHFRVYSDTFLFTFILAIAGLLSVLRPFYCSVGDGLRSYGLVVTSLSLSLSIYRFSPSCFSSLFLRDVFFFPPTWLQTSIFRRVHRLCCYSTSIANLSVSIGNVSFARKRQSKIAVMFLSLIPFGWPHFPAFSSCPPFFFFFFF